MHLTFFIKKRKDFAAVPDLTLRAARRALEFLSCGVTSLRTLGDAGGIDFALRDAIAAGEFPGPRLYIAGQPTTTTGGHGYAENCMECDGPYEVRRNVREQLKRGADFIKIMMTGGIMGATEGHASQQMTEDEVRAATEVAHWAGKHVAAHTGGASGVAMAVKCGVDTVEHCYALDQDVVDQMAQAGTVCVPTLVVTDSIPLYAAHGAEDWALRKLELAKPQHRRGFQLVLKSGCRFMVGSDLPSAKVNGVIATVREMQIMVELGASPLQVISAATKVPSDFFGLGSTLGTIEPGKIADLIAVDGDPCQDMRVLERPSFIMKDGKHVKTTQGLEHPDLGAWG
jgi:imidazolonepropionase-like amidohydrolase